MEPLSDFKNKFVYFLSNNPLFGSSSENRINSKFQFSSDPKF